MPPCVIGSSSISFSTSRRLCEGSPITTRGRVSHQDHADGVAPARVLDELGRHRLGLVEPARFAGS